MGSTEAGTELTSDWRDHLDSLLSNLKNERLNQQWWAALYNHVWPYIYSHNYRQLQPDHALAQDITQDVFLRLARQFGTQAPESRSFGEFESPEEFCNYLLVASRNRIIDYLRKEGRFEIASKELDRLVVQEVSQEELVLAADSLHNQVKTLSPDERQIAEMLIRGDKIKDIVKAKAGVWSASSVYTKISRLRQKLRSRNPDS